MKKYCVLILATLAATICMLLPSSASSAEASSEEVAEITLRGKAIKVQASWQGLNLWFTGKATITGAKGAKDHDLKNALARSAVTLAASCLRLSPTTQPARQLRESLSLGS